MREKRESIYIMVFIYALISGVGGLTGAIIYNVTNIGYVMYMLYCLIIQVVLVIWASRCYKKIHKEKKIIKKRINLNILWIIPNFILLALIFKNNIMELFNFDHVKLISLIVYFFTSICIGISEEIMFRGGVLEYYSNLSRKKAIIYSSLLFSLFHLSNFLISGNMFEVAIQLINTFIFGIFASGIVLRQKTLIPIIIYHSLWDFAMQLIIFGNSSSGIISVYSQLLTFIIGIILLISLKKINEKKHNKESV